MRTLALSDRASAAPRVWRRSTDFDPDEKSAPQCIKFILEKILTSRIVKKLDFVVGNNSLGEPRDAD
jgi:hypothetical protein